jgi:tetratricopeptide (TPR) repeat protein
MKACLLLPAESSVLQWLAAAPEGSTNRNGGVAGIRPAALQAVAWSDAKVLLEYRRGDFDKTIRQKFLADNAPKLATFSIIQTMASWQLKDYWGAMITWTKGYALVEAGARQGHVTLKVATQIFPGISEPDYLQAPWYDWAVADLLLRECDEMIGQAEQSVSTRHGQAPSLADLAIVRAAGERHALRGEWSDALRCAQYCLKSNQQDSLDHATMDYVNAAIASLELGDEKTYLRLREEMTTRYKNTGEVAPWRTLEAGLLRPIDDRVAATFKDFAAGLADWSRKETNNYWGLMLVSLHSYRLGDYDSAMDLARQSLARLRDGTRLPNAELSIILALSLDRQGNRSAALSELDQAESVIRTGLDLEYDMWHWRHWVGVRLLLQEARGLISQTPPPQSSAPPR